MYYSFLLLSLQTSTFFPFVSIALIVQTYYNISLLFLLTDFIKYEFLHCSPHEVRNSFPLISSGTSLQKFSSPSCIIHFSLCLSLEVFPSAYKYAIFKILSLFSLAPPETIPFLCYPEACLYLCIPCSSLPVLSWALVQALLCTEAFGREGVGRSWNPVHSLPAKQKAWHRTLSSLRKEQHLKLIYPGHHHFQLASLRQTSFPNLHKGPVYAYDSPVLLCFVNALHSAFSPYHSPEIPLVQSHQWPPHSYIHWLGYSFPTAAATNHHKYNGLKTTQFILTRFWRSEVQNGSSGLIFFWRL